MKPYEFSVIKTGWRAAAIHSDLAPLLGGHIVQDVDILVDDGADDRLPEERISLGAARMVWVTPETLRSGPFGGIAVVTSKTRLSGANRHRRGTMRSVALFRKFRDDPEKLEVACILSALVAMRNARPEFAKKTAGAIKEALDVLGFSCLQEIWARSSSAPMPIAMPVSAKKMCAKSTRADELGAVLRMWHDVAFRKLVAVSATPVRGGLGSLTLADFDEVADRYASGLNNAHGEEDWKALDRARLKRLVWDEPRSQLAARMGVSDVAISKRCRKEGIVLPPRGYWQRLEAEIDPRPLLESADIRPPAFVEKSLSQRFDVALAA